MIIGVCIILGAILLVVHYSNKSSSKTSATQSSTTVNQPGNSSNPYAVLAPATVPSKTAECSTPISFQTNGDSGPIQCANGDLNATEWNALAALEPSVLGLGYSPSENQVEADLCSDANASNSDANTKNSAIVEQTVYQIASLYYGWSFPSSPVVVLTSGRCG